MPARGSPTTRPRSSSPTAFDNDKGIGSIRGNQTNSLNGTADTRSPSWQKHNFRLGGTYLAPKGFVARAELLLPVRARTRAPS